MTRLTGMKTTHDRAIFCTRANKHTDTSRDGWTRAHLIVKDSQRTAFGNYLTYGITGLLFWILNHGGSVGTGLQLENPVRALRKVSRDPWLQAQGMTMNVGVAAYAQTMEGPRDLMAAAEDALGHAIDRPGPAVET